LRAGTSPNRQYFLKKLKELTKKKEDKVEEKLPEDSLFSNKQGFGKGQR